MPFVPVPEAIEEVRAGRILVVVDDEDRENEGDLTLAAEKVTPEIINFMAVQGRGLICLALTPERCDHLRLPLMSPTNTRVLRPPQPQNDLRGRPDPPPHEARALRAPCGRGLYPDRVWRVPHHRICQRPEPRVSPGAGARRGGGPGERAGAHAFALH